MRFETLKLTRIDQVLTLTLSNPTARNAVNGVMHHELPEAFAAIAVDDDVNVVVLTGDPDGRAFCAGGDLRWLRDGTGTGETYARVLFDGLRIVRSMLNVPQPIISMVNGAAIGLGATLALLCDVCLMDEDATIADPHVGVGVVAGDGGAAIWPLLVGPNRAKEFLMTGDPMKGKRAAEIGLVNHAVAQEELADQTFALAKRLARGPSLAIRLTKQSVNLHVRQVVEQVVPASLAMEGLTFHTADSREAISAFLKRDDAM